MQQQRIDARDPAAFLGSAVAHGREHTAQIVLCLLGVFGAGFLPRRRVDDAIGDPARRFDGLDERVGAAALHRNRRQHRDTELCREARHVDMHVTARGDIHAVERQHHRQTESFHLEREAQADGKVHRVDDAHHELRDRRVGDAPEQHVARDGFVERRRIQAVRARQIENAQRASVRRGAFAFAAFDGDTRVVSDLLAAARESVEERGLAAIGNSDERDAQRRRRYERVHRGR